MAFQHQVAGHTSSFETSDAGSALVKTAVAREIAFYTTGVQRMLQGSSNEDWWLPKCFGTMWAAPLKTPPGQTSLSEENNESIQVADLGPAKMLVLENITFPFRRPNVIDIKLGRRLYDDEASEEKKARLDLVSQSTTSAEYAMRISGFKVWNSLTSSYVTADKTFGKQLSSDQLVPALAHFFPGSLPVDSTSPLSPSLPPLSATGEMVLDTVHPMDKSHLVWLLSSIKADINRLIRLLKTRHFTMHGASLLIVYEGDGEALGRAITKTRENQQGEDQGSDDEDATSDAGDEDDISTTSSGSPHESILKAFDLRLIDFAHTVVKDQGGPDQGVLDGLASVCQILDKLAYYKKTPDGQGLIKYRGNDLI